MDQRGQAAPQGRDGRPLHIAHRRSPSEMTPLMSIYSRFLTHRTSNDYFTSPTPWKELDTILGRDLALQELKDWDKPKYAWSHNRTPSDLCEAPTPEDQTEALLRIAKALKTHIQCFGNSKSLHANLFSLEQLALAQQMRRKIELALSASSLPSLRSKQPLGEAVLTRRRRLGRKTHLYRLIYILKPLFAWSAGSLVRWICDRTRGTAI